MEEDGGIANDAFRLAQGILLAGGNLVPPKAALAIGCQQSAVRFAVGLERSALGSAALPSQPCAPRRLGAGALPEGEEKRAAASLS